MSYETKHYNMKNSEQPAYPTVDTINPETGDRCEPMNVGLTKREYFATMAMQGLLSNPAQIDTTDYKWVSEHAKGYADELLKQLES